MIYLADDVTAVNDIAAILKEYFRDLPQPLLPKEHYQAYIAAASKIFFWLNQYFNAI